MASDNSGIAYEAYLTGKYKEALSQFITIGNREGFSTAVVTHIVRSLGKLKRFAEAVEWAEYGLMLHPESQRLYAVLGDTYATSGFGEKAKLAYEKAIAAGNHDLATTETSAYVLDNLARSYLDSCRLKEAFAIISDLVSRYPGNERFLNHMKLLATHSDAYPILPEMENFLRGHFAVHNTDTVAVALAETIFRSLRHDEAMALLTQRVACNPEEIEPVLSLGEMYERLGDRSGAYRIYKNALEVLPHNAMFLHKAAIWEILYGSQENGKAYFSQISNPSGAMVKEYIDAAASKNNMSLLKNIRGKSWFESYFFNSLRNDAERKKLWSGFHEDYDAYTFPGVGFKNNGLAYCDIDSASVSFRDGMIIVPDMPETYVNRIFLLGDCTTSIGVTGSVTIVGQLQRLFNQHSRGAVRIEGYGVPGLSFMNSLLRLLELELRRGDLVFTFFTEINMSEEQGEIFSAIRDKCSLSGVRFHSFASPHLFAVNNPSPREKDLIAVYGNVYYGVIEAEEIRKRHTRMLKKNCEWFIKFKLPHTNLSYLFDRPHNHGELFTDHVHFNHIGNSVVAGEVFKISQNLMKGELPCIQNAPQNSEKFDCELAEWKRRAVIRLGGVAGVQYSSNQSLASWVGQNLDKAFSSLSSGKIGCIVMNCNPFTLGHRYLVETALKEVDRLYLLVVEEDRSVFPFMDRLRLVKQGVAQWADRVRVVPSGEYVISSFTFPGYFAKETRRLPMDATTDVLIFGAVIAPALNIKTRFVGEEPSCVVTDSYNRRMHYLLPDMGVEVRVIPRLEASGMPVSASSVRQALENNDWDTVAELVPESTLVYLRQRYGYPAPGMP